MKYIRIYDIVVFKFANQSKNIITHVLIAMTNILVFVMDIIGALLNSLVLSFLSKKFKINLLNHDLKPVRQKQLI
jgi:hypothetical protein